MPHKLRVPEETADLIRGLHPLLKTRVKAALRLIIDEPHSGKALKQELKGLRSFRVRKIRIIYRITGKKYIDITAIGPRKNIYEETYRIIKK